MEILDQTAFADAHTGIAIFDPGQNKFLYNYQGEKYFVPASNTKLASCYLAMKYLGDSLIGLKYEVLDDTTVLIKGMGDPTFLHPDFSHQPVLRFLKKFKSVELSPTDFSNYLGRGWSWGDYEQDYMVPRSGLPIYGDIVRFSLKEGSVEVQPKFFQAEIIREKDISKGFNVRRPWSQNTFTVSKGRNRNVDIPYVPYDSTIIHLLADTLHQVVSKSNQIVGESNYVYSQPLDSVLSIMMHRSDNFFAEQSLLMVSEKLLGKMDDRSIIQEVLSSDFADMPQSPGWVDGSGLSRYNLFSPRDFVFILNKMKDEFGMGRMKTILPTGGTGTLTSLYHNEAGYIFAKTGTLNGVVALSGYLITKKNKLLIFSILVNNHRSSSAEIRQGIEKFLIRVRNTL